jgi:hypothetical protein
LFSHARPARLAAQHLPVPFVPLLLAIECIPVER